MGLRIGKEDLEKIKKTGELSDEEYWELVVNSTPSLWCETHLNSPDPKEKDQPLTLQWYQKKFMDTSERMRSLRVGRGGGKSVGILGWCLWDLMTEPGVEIYYYLPGKSQLERVYTILEAMIRNSPEVSESIAFTADHKKALGKKDQIEHIINFKNGSRIIFFICASRPEKIRSHHGGKVVIDESHYIKQEYMTAILGIVVNMTDPVIIQLSTPGGRYGHFYDWDRDPNVFSVHAKSSDSRYWTPEKEKIARALCPDQASYDREYNAYFGREDDSVYFDEDIDRALALTSRAHGNVMRSDYILADRYLDRSQMWDEYIGRKKHLFIGIDWNSPNAGVQIVYLFELTDGSLVVPRVDSISADAFTQMGAVEHYISLYREFTPEKTAVDIGFGHVQIELINKYAMLNNMPEMLNRLSAIDFASKITIASEGNSDKRPDMKGSPYAGNGDGDIKIRTKTYMVGLLCKELKSNNIAFPAFEDEKDGLIRDLRTFKLKGMADSGEPIYGGGTGQHKHMALILSLYARDKHKNNGTNVQNNSGIIMTATHDLIGKNMASLIDPKYQATVAGRSFVVESSQLSGKNGSGRGSRTSGLF